MPLGTGVLNWQLKYHSVWFSQMVNCNFKDVQREAPSLIRTQSPTQTVIAFLEKSVYVKIAQNKMWRRIYHVGSDCYTKNLSNVWWNIWKIVKNTTSFPLVELLKLREMLVLLFPFHGYFCTYVYSNGRSWLKGQELPFLPDWFWFLLKTEKILEYKEIVIYPKSDIHGPRP